MAIPVILETSSVLTWLQHEAWEFQPLATNTPTSWTTTALPSGVTFNTSTGLVSGPSNVPGVFIFELMAVNGDGPSLPQIFTLGIDATYDAGGGDAIDIEIDLDTRAVTTAKPIDFKVPPGSDQATKPAPIIHAKYNDMLLFRVRWTRAGVRQELPITKCRVAISDLETEGELVQSADADFTAVGSGEDYFVWVYLKLADTQGRLKAELADHEDDSFTYFVGLTEFEWELTKPSGAPGPSTIRTTSQTFGTLLPRDEVLN